MKVHMKQALMLMILSMALITVGKRIQTPPADSTNLLQSKVKVQTALEVESESVADVDVSGEYVPGTPGAPWTQEEVLAVRAKLWKILGMTLVETGDLYASLLEEGWDKSQHHFRKIYMNRMVSTWTRLAFHGSFPNADGTGGSDGCLFWDGIGEVYFDHFNQRNLGHKNTGHNTAPNFNNGLGPAVMILEEVYKNASFPSRTPILNKSLFESGKSRADLWAFAGNNAVEFGTFLNNMICQYPDFEYTGTYWPDSIESNSWNAQHCNQFYGTPNCTVDLQEGLKFKTGRKDCLPFDMFKKVDSPTCKKNLGVKTKSECVQAANALQLPKDAIKFDKVDGETFCRYTDNGGDAYTSLCYLSLTDKYNDGLYSYYVQMPIYDYGKACRRDLAVTTEEECKQAAKYLKLTYDDRRLAASGCFIIDMTFPHNVREWHVHFGEGDYPDEDDRLKGLYPSWGTGYGKEVKMVCRYEDEPVRPYMASTWGGGPDSQVNGEATVNYFKDTFGMTRRDTIAILGAHTFGRFHAISEIFRYIWVRNGGSLFNNAYHRNVAGKKDWRFRDPGCQVMGDAYGNRGPARWTAIRRHEMDDKGPVNWMLERYTCLYDCKLPDNLDHQCCRGIPPGGFCTPDNNRPNYTYTNDLDPPPDDDNINGGLGEGCEGFNTETGQHEAATPAEMGMYFKFSLDENGEPYGCPGMETEHIDKTWKTRDMGCPKNDMPLDEEGTDMKMYQLIDLYADDQAAWIKDFNVAWQKMVETGYRGRPGDQPNEVLVDAPLSQKNVVCPTQEYVPKDLQFWSCFAADDRMSHLSEPFLLQSHLDGHFLQTNVSSGILELSADASNPGDHQKWYIATTGVMKTLVNGKQHFGVGNWSYDKDHHLLIGSGGLLMRRPDTLHNADLMFVKQAHVSWLSAAWAAIGVNDAQKMPPQKIPPCVVLKSVQDKYVTLGEDQVLGASKTSVSVSEQFKVIVNADGSISFEAPGGLLVYADDDGSVKASDDCDLAKTKFTLLANLDGTISLKSYVGNFMAATDAGLLEASKAPDKFYKEVMKSGKVAYKSIWDKYIGESWNGNLYADRTWNAEWSPWNHFEVIKNSDDTISFKTQRGFLWKAEKTATLDAFEDNIGPLHKFTEIQNDDGSVGLKSANGELLVASGSGYLFNSKRHAEGPMWENFVPSICHFDEIKVNPCPIGCLSPICVSGSSSNGGVMMTPDGKCTATASQQYSSTRYCGNGPSYVSGASLDCSKCA
mmetsp:Transcript_56314/g.103346  ORF Transcript_56314/g.103346 Transcript_56314/m.103346 type:complete len:1241 (-) Transcript_56314:62-3784(-)